jgi:hypothetical protein
MSRDATSILQVGGYWVLAKRLMEPEARHRVRESSERNSPDKPIRAPGGRPAVAQRRR